ncbi:HEPN domain-containing protein [Patescibacteria group bacterium]|nr:HEPN domain-containing protein [Pseudomonadota bacterium]MBU4455760.1 HEPN domain-containing protein [Patescibacteria group bacterium]
MTEENRRENIRAELDRAAEALAAATLLYENGYISDAISRLYYFVLYHVRALLLSKGLEPRSHDAALRLLGMHFVREGLIDRRAAQVFSKLMKFREEADYNPVSMFTGEDFVEFKGEAEIFAASVKSYLVAPPRKTLNFKT